VPPAAQPALVTCTRTCSLSRPCFTLVLPVLLAGGLAKLEHAIASNVPLSRTRFTKNTNLEGAKES
jgi:hypothetical protein